MRSERSRVDAALLTHLVILSTENLLATQIISSKSEKTTVFDHDRNLPGILLLVHIKPLKIELELRFRVVLKEFNSHAVAVRNSLRRRCVPLRYIFSFNSLSIFYFSRIKSVITSLLRNSLRFSWWSPFVCRSIIRGPRVPKRMVYFRENLEHEIRGYWWLNPKVSVQV